MIAEGVPQFAPKLAVSADQKGGQSVDGANPPFAKQVTSIQFIHRTAAIERPDLLEHGSQFCRSIVVRQRGDHMAWTRVVGER